MSGSSDQVRQIYDPVADTPTCYVRGEADPPAAGLPRVQATQLRHPKQPLIHLPQNVTELTGPAIASLAPVGELDNDLTRQHEGEPLGERMTVFGRVFDAEANRWQHAGRDLAGQRVWALPPSLGPLAGPLNPNFSGAGRAVTDDDGRFRFVTIKPGPYPWGNHYNAWRPAPRPLLVARPRVRAASGDPDVLPRRPAVPLTTRSSIRFPTRPCESA